MIYLHKFETQALCDDYMESQQYEEPFVGLINETSAVIFNKKTEPIDYSKVPLTFEILGDGDIYFNSLGFASLEYKVNDNDWKTATEYTLPVTTGDIIEIKAPFDTINTSLENMFSDSNCRFNVYGNIMSLLDGENFETLVDLGHNSIFGNLFKYCSELISAENLVLPATTLADDCYEGMFSECSSLTTAPELPTTTLADYCYYFMFSECTSLTTAPELPATTLADNCYDGMFYGCTSLTTAPALPATTLADNCYSCMFQNCTSLTTAPALPATTLADACYYCMFENCTSLTTAPALPATTLADYCYNYMFLHCTSLTTAPELPATTLADNCYEGMFSECSSLTTAPALPATTLADYCYNYMFLHCTSLTTAPELPATTLAQYCYNGMFQNCSSLNYIKCLATNISANSCTGNWVSGVSSGGTFVKNSNMNVWPTGNNGIPSGWTVEDNV